MQTVLRAGQIQILITASQMNIAHASWQVCHIHWALSLVHQHVIYPVHARVKLIDGKFVLNMFE